MKKVYSMNNVSIRCFLQISYDLYFSWLQSKAAHEKDGESTHHVYMLISYDYCCAWKCEFHNNNSYEVCVKQYESV